MQVGGFYDFFMYPPAYWVKAKTVGSRHCTAFPTFRRIAADPSPVERFLKFRLSAKLSVGVLAGGFLFQQAVVFYAS